MERFREDIGIDEEAYLVLRGKSNTYLLAAVADPPGKLLTSNTLGVV